MQVNDIKDAIIMIFKFKKRDEPCDSYSVILNVGKLVNGCNTIQGYPANDWDG